MSIPSKQRAIARDITRRLKARGVRMTTGGEPTYVPVEPKGLEWSITATGPTKLKYAYAMAGMLSRDHLHGGIPFFSPGKTYPGEVNPRWTVHIIWRRDGKTFGPMPAKKAAGKPSAKALARLRKEVGALPGRGARWLRGVESSGARCATWILPLDHDGKRWLSAPWLSPKKDTLKLGTAEGPAGLRLPLNLVPEGVSKRALVVELRGGRLHFFFPPLLQKPFLKLLQASLRIFRKCGIADPVFEGYIPPDDGAVWSKISLTADPGVLEINLPPCETWNDYAGWLETLHDAATKSGLRSFKQFSPEEVGGTGGGNHLIFGGRILDENAFFKHPRWVTSILRYWQRHPSLSYLFTGSYVGGSSQAPRTDESARALYDIEMAYRFLERLKPGDQRYLISETLRHLHTDGTGNTHRSEVSFDKFWNPSSESGCRGLIEFRAIESLPDPASMSEIALLWQALAVMLLEKPCTTPLIAHGARLHDYYFLPTLLWGDFQEVLRDLAKGGFRFDEKLFRKIWEWRFPVMLRAGSGGDWLEVRKALEDWPLLCETPLEGGTTSRFVDTSIERLELVATKRFTDTHEIRAQGRTIQLDRFPDGLRGAGLRYRRTALYPSLHPGIPPHMPLYIEIIQKDGKGVLHRLDDGRRLFQKVSLGKATPPAHAGNAKRLEKGLLTYDLRLG